MGVDINIYLDLDQDNIKKYIEENHLDRNSYIDCQKISNHFFPELDTSCYYDEDLDIYKIYVSHGIKFLRNNKKLNDNVYHKLLEKRNSKKLKCTYFDICRMYDKDDIINIIEELRFWFPDEEEIVYFSYWLEKISNYSIIYINID